MNLSHTSNIAGRKNSTMINASSAPLPSNNPMEPTIGLEDVIHKINPTLDQIAADIEIEKVFSSSVLIMAFLADISLR